MELGIILSPTIVQTEQMKIYKIPKTDLHNGSLVVLSRGKIREFTNKDGVVQFIAQKETSIHIITMCGGFKKHIFYRGLALNHMFKFCKNPYLVFWKDSVIDLTGDSI